MPTTTTPHVQFRSVDGLRIRYADSGGSPDRRAAHQPLAGEPLRVRADLGHACRARPPVRRRPAGLRCVRAPRRPLSPRAMGGFLRRLIDEAELGPSAHRRARRRHLRRTVRGGGATGADRERDRGHRRRSGAARARRAAASWVLDPDLDKYRADGPARDRRAAVDTIAGGVPDDVRADYLDCYDGDRFAESMRYVRRYPEELPELAELLPEIATPVTIINGRHDRVVPVANAEFLDERLPTSRLGHRRRALRLGGGARRVRLDRPRLDQGQVGLAVYRDSSGLRAVRRRIVPYAGSAFVSSRRDVMPSLANTLRRCHSTVRGLRNSRAPISGFERPSRASRAICASCGVSSSRVSRAALAHRLAGGRPARAARARRTPPCPIADEHLVGDCAAARARRHGGSRGAATRRRAGARGRSSGRSRVRSRRSIASR